MPAVAVLGKVTGTSGMLEFQWEGLKKMYCLSSLRLCAMTRLRSPKSSSWFLIWLLEIGSIGFIMSSQASHSPHAFSGIRLDANKPTKDNRNLQFVCND